jgi:hypothetical protein
MHRRTRLRALPTTGVAYIIGGSPTGAWSGHATKIAQWTGSAWNILTPAEGWTAYNQALDATYVYNSGWVSQAGAIITSGTSGWFTPPSDTTGGSGNYTYDASNQATLHADLSQGYERNRRYRDCVWSKNSPYV